MKNLKEIAVFSQFRNPEGRKQIETAQQKNTSHKVAATCNIKNTTKLVLAVFTNAVFLNIDQRISRLVCGCMN